MKKAAKPLLIVSLVISILYLVGIFIYIGLIRGATGATLNASGMSGYNAIAQYSISYVLRLLMPHFLTCGLAIVFNIVAIAKRDIPWFALAAAILFTISLFLAYGSYWAGVIVEAVLCFIAFAGLMQKDKAAESVQHTVEQAGNTATKVQEPATDTNATSAQQPTTKQIEEKQ